MNHSQRVSLRVFVGIEIGCFILLIAGVLTACSPFWTPGGLFGPSEEDFLGILEFSGALLSILLGILLCIAAAAVGIWIGIAAGIVGLVSSRARREQAKLTAVKDLGDAGSDQ